MSENQRHLNVWRLKTLNQYHDDDCRLQRAKSRECTYDVSKITHHLVAIISLPLFLYMYETRICIIIHQIGVWHSYEKENNGLDIKDIVWPGHSHVPPQGVPEKFHLSVGFLEESPFVNLDPPDPVSGKCNIDRGVPCRVPLNQDEAELGNSSLNSTADYSYQCCSGFWYATDHTSKKKLLGKEQNLIHNNP